MILRTVIITAVVLVVWIIGGLILRKRPFWQSWEPKKGIKFLIVLGISLIVLTSPFLVTKLTHIYNPSGYAEWKDGGNNQSYLYIETDNYYDLGYLEGQFLGKQILSAQLLIAMMFRGTEYGYSFFAEEAPKYLAYIPDDYIDEMEGMARGATAKTGTSITFTDILIQNTFIDVIYGQIYPVLETTSAEIACTAIGVQNNDSTMVFGQNFDFPRVLNDKGFSEKGYLPGLAFVHVKMEGVAEIFGLRLGGILNMPCGITSNGIKAFINVVHSNATNQYQTPMMVTSRQALETATSITEFRTIMVGNLDSPLVSCSYNMLLVDETTLQGVQCYSNYVDTYASPYVGTNRYINETSNAAVFTRGNYSLDRQEYVTQYINTTITMNAEFTEADLMTVLGERGNETVPAICREGPSLSESITLAFLTGNSFGLGTVYDGLGTCPL